MTTRARDDRPHERRLLTATDTATGERLFSLNTFIQCPEYDRLFELAYEGEPDPALRTANDFEPSPDFPIAIRLETEDGRVQARFAARHPSFEQARAALA